MILQRCLRINVEKRYRVHVESLHKIKMQAKAHFSEYISNSNQISASHAALFLVRLRSTFRQLVKNQVCGNISVRRSRCVKMARPKLSWAESIRDSPNAFAPVHVAGDAREAVLAVCRKECINWNFRTDAACFGIHTRHEQRICLRETHARIFDIRCSVIHVERNMSHITQRGYCESSRCKQTWEPNQNVIFKKKSMLFLKKHACRRTNRCPSSSQR